MPAWMTVALGGGARASERLRVSDYAAYARLVRGMFEAFVATEAAYPPPTRPSPWSIATCAAGAWTARRPGGGPTICPWSPESRRANAAACASTRLTPAGVWPASSCRSSGDPGTGAEALARVRDQASIQVRGEHEGRHLRAAAPSRDREGALVPNLGLLSLPEPSPGDLFFDIEGDPFALETASTTCSVSLSRAWRRRRGQPTFHRIWSIDEAGEVTPDAEHARSSSSSTSSWTASAADPSLHIYHYAPYEPTAIGRLMGRYATREDEVDRLMRGKVFVDLFRAVRQGLRASVESYSIKKLEPLYGLRAHDRAARRRLQHLEFETWLELGGEARDGPEILDRIAALQPGRLRLHAAAARLARGAAPPLAASIGEPVPRRPMADATPTERAPSSSTKVDSLVERLAGGIRRTARIGMTAAGALDAGQPSRVASARGEAGVVALLPSAERSDGRGTTR